MHARHDVCQQQQTVHRRCPRALPAPSQGRPTLLLKLLLPYAPTNMSCQFLSAEFLAAWAQHPSLTDEERRTMLADTVLVEEAHIDTVEQIMYPSPPSTVESQESASESPRKRRASRSLTPTERSAPKKTHSLRGGADFTPRYIHDHQNKLMPNGKPDRSPSALPGKLVRAEGQPPINSSADPSGCANALYNSARDVLDFIVDQIHHVPALPMITMAYHYANKPPNAWWLPKQKMVVFSDENSIFNFPALDPTM
ncbi:hypothetical protein P171DRAFT_471182 [Karstenula rhodostoma CBS 690.94]|uniref:Uncharacterized protein n=1 Tax=Karstenula rhodostoma CBS 690.94 TaxID=1392251 RepID=A0A9P4PKC5_9PLEO|nr:hypothetical protein P171DRAFT_471182 [Karstenula rhodostoma CBS 690.94]